MSPSSQVQRCRPWAGLQLLPRTPGGVVRVVGALGPRAPVEGGDGVPLDVHRVKHGASRVAATTGYLGLLERPYLFLEELVLSLEVLNVLQVRSVLAPHRLDVVGRLL